MVTSDGYELTAEGWGYYTDDPNPICEPLDKIGEEPPSDMAFCAAHGCSYNPPNLSDPPSGPGPPSGNENLATTPVTPTDPPAAELVQQMPESQPEPEPNNNEDSTNDGGGSDEGSTEGEQGSSEEEGEGEVSEK